MISFAFHLNQNMPWEMEESATVDSQKVKVWITMKTIRASETPQHIYNMSIFNWNAG